MVKSMNLGGMKSMYNFIRVGWYFFGLSFSKMVVDVGMWNVFVMGFVFMFMFIVF